MGVVICSLYSFFRATFSEWWWWWWCQEARGVLIITFAKCIHSLPANESVIYIYSCQY